MAKVLLVDTNFSAVPIYHALIAEGHEVHVVGGNPMDCLAKQARYYWRLDYSDTDALEKLVDKQDFKYLIPGCTDRSYESCVVVGRGRFPGLDSLSVASAISHKAKFRSVAASLGLQVPQVFRDLDEFTGRSIVVKPVDAFSGKGIKVLHEPTAQLVRDAKAIARSASPTRGALVEEFIDGQLYSHSAFLSERRVIFDFLVREDATANRFVVDTSKVLSSAEYASILSQLRASVNALAENLGLQNGLIHTQFIANSSGVWLIEMTRRCPGDLYSQLIELSTGCQYSRNYVMAFLGRPQLRLENRGNLPIMRHTISVSDAQSFDHVRFLRRVDLERYIPLSIVGDSLAPSPGGRVAVIFLREKSQIELDELYATTLRRELYTVENFVIGSSLALDNADDL